MAIFPLVPDSIGPLKFLIASNRETGITATASGNQTTAYQMGAQVNVIGTCVTAADSVKLPRIVATPGVLSKTGASIGAIVYVFNQGASSAQVFGAGTDTINAVATATGVAQGAATGSTYIATGLASGVGTWVQTTPSTAVASVGTFASITGSADPFPINGLAAAQGGAVTITGGVSSTSANAGGLTKIIGGGPGATGVGGGAQVVGAIGGATSGAGGAVAVTGGAGTAGNAAGGAATVTGGAGQGSAAGGAVTITSGAAGATGVAGVVTVQVGAATAGAGSALNLKSGAGAGGTAAGGNLDLSPGAAVSTGIPGEITVLTVAGLFDAVWQQYLPASVPVSGTSYTFFLANRAYRVKNASIICSSSATVPTVDVIKDSSTNAPGAGTSVLTGVMTFSATANTRVTGTASSTIATVTLAAGDRLSAKFAGTVGSITGAILSVTLVPC